MTFTLDKLYANCNDLTDAKDKIAEHSDKYQEIIDAAKQSPDANVKKLASQLIARYFKYFPTLHFQALEALFDLCEDDDVNIRKQSIKDLPNLCKDNKENVPRIADILAQLLQSDDPQEQSITSSSLISVISTDAPNALRGIFQQMQMGDDLVKERCFKFLATRFKILEKEVITKEAEDVVVDFCKNFIENATGEEFKILLQLLGYTHLPKTLAGQKEIIAMIEKHADLDQPFDLHDSSNYCLHMITVSVAAALPHFSAQISSNAFVKYYCEKVLPHFEDIAALENGESAQLVVLRNLADLTNFCTSYEKIEDSIISVYNKLLNYMPPPPENNDIETFPKQEFSFVECLLYIFHKLARHHQTFLSTDEERLKDFRARLQYFARGLQGCIKKLNEKIAVDDSLKKEKRSTEIIKMLTNINMLIKDLFRNPPIYKATVNLSWVTTAQTTPKKIQEKPIESNGSSNSSKQKRHTPITFDGDTSVSPSKQAKIGARSSSSDQQKIYTPPSGKYSNKFTKSSDRRGRGGRISRGGSRGSYRGSNRGSWRY